MITASMATVSPAGPLLYSFSLGLVAAVNPCGFPLLPAYLMLSSGQRCRQTLTVRALRAMSSGAAMTVGFVIVFGIVAAVVKLGVGLALGWVPWIMVPVGVACLVAGVLGAAGRSLPVRLPVPRLPKDRSRPVTLMVFGVGYAVASLTCALPLFLVGVTDSFVRRGTAVGLACGMAYALGMGLMVTAVSLAGAGARHVRLRRARAVEPILERCAAVVVALVGGYLVLYWITDLIDPFSSPAPVLAVEWVQNRLASVLTASPRLVGLLIGASILGILGVATLHAVRRDQVPAAAQLVEEPSGAPRDRT